jgi:GNAT superfamily N-acetyltransferase
VIRLMERRDLEGLTRLKAAAGWNQTEQDWVNLMTLEPEGCWVDERDGGVAASTTAVCYGTELAWIGMVLTLPEFRGRGLARGLMEHCLRWLEGRGVRQVKLDATDMGRPLYEKLGFREERRTERWGASREKATTPEPAQLPAASVAACDRETFGVDRSRLIGQLVSAFPGQGEWLEGGGFILGRPGANAYFLGPCAATGAEVARRLIAGLMDRSGEQRFLWDLFPDHGPAAAVAQGLGFERRRQLVRMSLRPGASAGGKPERVFAAAGFEYG